MTVTAVIPYTGEVVELATETAARLAALTDEIRDVEARLRELKGLISRELHGRMDLNASWTIETDDWIVRGSSPDRVTYDVATLRPILGELVDEGLISMAAADAAIIEEITYKTHARPIEALRKLGQEIRDRIDVASLQADPERRTIKLERRR